MIAESKARRTRARESSISLLTRSKRASQLAIKKFTLPIILISEFLSFLNNYMLSRNNVTASYDPLDPLSAQR